MTTSEPDRRDALLPLERSRPRFTTTFVETFDRPSPPGRAYEDYAHAIAGYGDTDLYRTANVSVHDGVLDVRIPGDGTGAVLVIGPAATRWGWRYGRATVRFKAVGASGTGAAFMLWPSNNVWSDGEVNAFEGGFGGTIKTFQHPSPCYPDPRQPVAGLPYCGTNAAWFDTGSTWREWHEGSVEWTPDGVTYLLDGTPYLTVGHDKPKGDHRFTIQAANPGARALTEPGHLLIDDVRIDAYIP